MVGNVGHIGIQPSDQATSGPPWSVEKLLNYDTDKLELDWFSCLLHYMDTVTREFNCLSPHFGLDLWGLRLDTINISRLDLRRSDKSRLAKTRTCSEWSLQLAVSKLHDLELHIFFCFDLKTDGSFTQDFILKILKIFYNWCKAFRCLIASSSGM